MKTMTKQNPRTIADRTRRRDTGRKDGMPEAQNEVSPQQRQPGLIESSEYEWTTALNLPGLIVPSTGVQPAKAREGRTIWPYLDGMIETEDGDAVSFCQLPGRLGSPTEIQPSVALSTQADGRSEWAMDEYTEIAAMQMPGLLVEAIASADSSAEHAVARGLCASCLHRDHCSFPRPSSGVWRCEEYA